MLSRLFFTFTDNLQIQQMCAQPLFPQNLSAHYMLGFTAWISLTLKCDFRMIAHISDDRDGIVGGPTLS